MVSLKQVISARRRTAIQSVRSQMRKIGTNPKTATVDEAWAVLDDLNRTEPDLQACFWYRGSGAAQQRLFARDWKAYQKIGYGP